MGNKNKGNKGNNESRLSILVVDDEPEMIDIISSHLEGRYNVYKAADSNEGLIKFYKHNPDIVISDVNLPDMNGFRSTQIMKDEKPNIGIIIMTGYHNQENVSKSIYTGIDFYLQKPFKLQELEDSVKIVYNKLVDDELERENHEMKGLSTLIKTIEHQDPYTADHSNRVKKLSVSIAQELGLLKEEIYKIAKAAYVHDIGKIDYNIMQVVKKEGKLTKDEFEIIKKHPVIGVDILKGNAGYKPFLNIVLCHHKNNDGSGYPEYIPKEKIPFGAKILKVADVYDALTTSRSYRGAMPDEKAIYIMEAAKNTEFHPDPLKVLIEMKYQNIL